MAKAATKPQAQEDTSRPPLPPEVERIINGGPPVEAEKPAEQTPSPNGHAHFSNGTTDQITDAAPPAQSLPPPAQDPPEVVAPEVPTVAGVETLLIEIPIGPIESRFPPQKIDLRLSGQSATKMHRILNGLKRAKYRLKNDMPIRSNADAIRWLLEQVEVPCE